MSKDVEKAPKQRLAEEIVLAVYPWIGSQPVIVASVMEQIRQALAKYDVTDAP